MGNSKNYNYNKYDLKLSNQNYTDFYLNTDYYHTNCGNIDDTCLIGHFDFNNISIFTSPIDLKNINSLVSWSNATNYGISALTYGLTGLDNGVLTYNRDLIGDPNNDDLTSVLLNSILTIPQGNNSLFLTQVSGSTRNINYNMNYVEPNSLEAGYMEFKGGFYQGYYKLDGYDYQTLPNRFKSGYMIDTWLKRDDSIMSGMTGNTLNNLYPNNKGFFLYFGTRAENKFWNQFSGNTSGDCSNSKTDYCTTIKEEDVFLTLDNGFTVPLLPPAIEFTEITNQFLIYGRGRGRGCDSGRPHDGLGVYSPYDFSGSSTPSITVSGYSQTEKTDNINPFLIYGRSRGRRCDSGRPEDNYGKNTAYTYSGNTLDPLKQLDVNYDVGNNALGFRVRDDGAIGYRMLSITGTCVNDIYTSGITVNEEYTVSGLVANNQWVDISIRWVPFNILDDCGIIDAPPRRGKIMIYVDGFLKHIFNDFPEFIARRLNELKDKQVGVPFNVSLGGGTHGLLESLTFDGQDPNDLGLNIEQNFAGSFIGAVGSFKIYDCNKSWCFIKEQYKINSVKYIN